MDNQSQSSFTLHAGSCKLPTSAAGLSLISTRIESFWHVQLCHGRPLREDSKDMLLFRGHAHSLTGCSYWLTWPREAAAAPFIQVQGASRHGYALRISQRIHLLVRQGACRLLAAFIPECFLNTCNFCLCFCEPARISAVSML